MANSTDLHLVVSTSALSEGAKTLRSLATNAQSHYGSPYNQLLSNLSSLSSTMQDWSLSNIKTWDSSVQNQIFQGYVDLANALDKAASAYNEAESNNTQMFTPQ